MKSINQLQELLIVKVLFTELVHHAGYWGCQTSRHALTIQPTKITSEHAHSSNLYLLQQLTDRQLSVTSSPLKKEKAWHIASCFHHETFTLSAAHRSGDQVILTLENPLKHRYTKQSLVAYPITESMSCRHHRHYDELVYRVNHEPEQRLLGNLSRCEFRAAPIPTLIINTPHRQYRFASQAVNAT